MKRLINKPFAVMVLGVFALGFLVTTATTLTTFASQDETARISLVDNSSTKDLTMCVNGQKAVLQNSIYTLNPGKADIRIYTGKIEEKNGCDSDTIKHRKVFSSTQDLAANQTYEITVTGKAELVGVVKHNKTVLVDEKDLKDGKKPKSIVSWKSVTDSNVTRKDAFCVDKKIIKEDKPGSKQAVIEPGVHLFSFEYDQKGDMCNPILPLSEGHTLELSIGCKDGKYYEIGTKRDDDFGSAYYKGLNFTTKLSKKEQAEVTPLRPIESTPVPTNQPKLMPIPTTTVRSGGLDFGLIALSLFVISSGAYIVYRRKNIKI
jgi:hypothetical protein